MLEFLNKNLSTHAIFSIFLGIVVAALGLVVAGAFNYSMVGVGVWSFVLAAVVYLVLDFYESFGNDFES